MPAGIELSVAGNTDAVCPIPKGLQIFQRRNHFLFPSNNTDFVLHRLLQIVLQSIRVFARPTLEWCDSVAGRSLDFFKVDFAQAIFLREYGRVFARALSEYQKIRKRISTKT